jgi:cation transport ATPase
MDVLVSLGTTISFVYSAGATIYALLHPEFARMALIETL